MGKGGERTFDKSHKLLNRAKWSTLQGAKIMLDQLVGSSKETITIALDEHLERRRGRKIKAKGYYRDAVRSTKKAVVKCTGLKWLTVMVLKKFSWNSRRNLSNSLSISKLDPDPTGCIPLIELVRNRSASPNSSHLHFTGIVLNPLLLAAIKIILRVIPCKRGRDGSG